jgi:hypothetical protein
MIVSIAPSKVKHKRYVITMQDGKKYNFGLDTGSTYIDHHDKDIREAYRARHMGNTIEKKLINNLVPSPSLFSFYILWGPHTSIEANVKHLNVLLKNK